MPDAVKVFEGLDPQGIVLVAVSGGSDSMALLLLANVWAQKRDVTLHAVTIDHGLRPEAAAEAAFVAAVCEGLGIDHTTLAWEGLKPPTGISEAARNARYALIEDFALEIGADLVLTGHTGDDQAETVLMRARRGGQRNLGRGLAGMARISVLPGGTMLARPLLGHTRSQLRSFLATFPQSHIEDPSNDDPSYERVRVRRELAVDPELSGQLNSFAIVMRRWRGLLAQDTANLLSHLASVKPGPVFRFELDVALAAPLPVLVHTMQVLLAVGGGGEQLASRLQVEAMIAGFAGGDTQRMNLAGVIIEREGSGLRFFREARNIDSAFIEAGETMLWDGRLEIANGSRGRIHVAPVTRSGLAAIETARKSLLPGKPRAALHSSAVIRTADGRQYLPLIDVEGQPPQVHARLTAQAIESFCPEADFPLLEWLRGMELARRAFLLPKT